MPAIQNYASPLVAGQVDEVSISARVFELQNLTDWTDFQPGDKFVGCNFSQAVPHTSIGAGVPGLVFERCNLNNCDLPSDVVTVDCVQAHFDRPTPIELTDDMKAAAIEKQAVALDAQAADLHVQAATLSKAVGAGKVSGLGVAKEAL